MTLNVITHDLHAKLRRGPAAIAAVTGRPTPDIVPVLRALQHTDRIQCAAPLYLLKPLRHFGVLSQEPSVPDPSTLAAALDDHQRYYRSDFSTMPADIVTTRHHQVVEAIHRI